MSNPLQRIDSKRPETSQVVVLVAIAFILFILTVVFIFFNNNQYLSELDLLAETSETGSKKMQLYNEFAELARGRTRNTLQILNAEDVFEQDELNQQLEGYAARFADVRERLDAMPFSVEDKKLYDSAFDWVPQVLPAQRKAVELLMFGGDKNEARRLINGKVLPGQQQIINIFSELTRREQQHIRQNALAVQNSVKQIHRFNNTLFVVVFFAISIISILVILRILKIQDQLKRSYSDLEEMVHERTVDLEVARDEALTASRAKTEFLSSMSHELRTPLNAIIGFSQLLEMEELEQYHMDSVSEIHKAGKHLLELINEVLDLAKIEAGKMTLKMGEVDVALVLSEVSMLASPIAERHEIVVDYDMDCDLQVQADLTRLKQVMINLVSNAIKYNSKRGRVEVLCSLESGKVKISVTDTGPGISADQQEALFQPFNRLDAEGTNVEGTGIGLMITRQLVEMMDGEIGLDSKVGEGSTFWVLLQPVEVQHS